MLSDSYDVAMTVVMDFIRFVRRSDDRRDNVIRFVQRSNDRCDCVTVLIGRPGGSVRRMRLLGSFLRQSDVLIGLQGSAEIFF